MFTQLKLAIRILRRRKFFTFISLFGISFTIMALVVISALGDAAAGNNPPLSDRDLLVFATHFRSERVVPDTNYIIDSTLSADQVMLYDSTMQIGEDVQSDNNSQLAIHLYNTHLLDMPGAVSQTYNAPAARFDTYLDGRKVSFGGNFTTSDYWDVFDYEYLFGQPYSEEDVKAGALKAVMTEDAAIEYFGIADGTLIGKKLPLADQTFTIVGIVAKPRASFAGFRSDVFVPYTVAPQNFHQHDFHGPGYAVFKAETKAGRQIIIDELDRIAENLEPLPEMDRNRFHLEGLTFGQEFADNFVGEGIDREKSFGRFIPPIIVLVLMLVMLPALNLMNINVSRVYERSAEIAVRKSFGATDGDILRQFITETIVLTFIGGVIGVLLALGLISIINTEDWLGGFTLSFTPEVAMWTLAIVFVFALITGVLPAWRMAKTKIATSLR
ncbi:MAG: ABC transporter permease [Saprospiraceae bacterium]